MRTATAGLLLVACATLAACSDPSLAIEVRYDDPALPGQLRSMTIEVVALPAKDGLPRTCDDVRYGRISRDELDGARRASAAAGQVLAGVPRLGDKLVLLEGRDAGGVRIAGGCEALHDIDADLTLPVAAELAPRVRIIDANSDPSASPGDVRLAVGTPWRDGAAARPLANVELEVDVLDRAARATPRARATVCSGDGPGGACPGDDPTGAVQVRLAGVADDLVPGPVELRVRPPWADAPLTVPSFQALDAIDRETLAGDVTIGLPNQAAPSWAVVRTEAGVRAAAIHAAGTPPRYRVIELDLAAGQRELERHEVDAGEPVHALAVWNDAIVTLTASGWRALASRDGVVTLTPGVDGSGEAASELVTLDRCASNGPNGGPPLGLLVRTAAGPYAAYDAPGVPHTATDDTLATFTARVNRLLPGRIVDTLCLTYPAALDRVAVVRSIIRQGNQDMIATTLVRVHQDDVAVSPIVSGFLAYPDHGTGLDAAGPWRLAGAVADITGPRLASYTLAGVQGLADDDGRLDGELTSFPTSMALADAGGDGTIDMIATAHEVLGDSRVQLTFPATSGAPALTGLSPAIRGGAPLVLVSDAGGDHWLAAVATTEQLVLFDVGALATTEGP